MKKYVSKIIYILFFLVVTAIITSCILLLFKLNPKSGFDTSNTDPNQINAVTISGDESDLSYQEIPSVSFKKSPYYAAKNTSYGKYALSSGAEKQLYDMIASSVYVLSENKDENGHFRTSRIVVKNEHMSVQTIRKVTNAFIYDNPQVFWLDNLFGYAYTGDDTTVELYSVISADECKKKLEILTKEVDSITGSIKDGLSEFEREKEIHDILLSKCTYKNGVSVMGDGWEYFSSFGAIVNGESVCEGYAKSMQILLSISGIECVTIRGEGNGDGHMWNVVNIGGSWYHLDPTWDDAEADIIYDFFNVSDEMILTSHTINPYVLNVDLESSDDVENTKYNFFVPECNSTEAGYYSKTSVALTDFDSKTDEKIIRAIVKAANQKETYLPIMFGTEMTYNEYIDTLFNNQPYKFYSYVVAANEKLDGEHQIDKDGLSIFQNESANIVRVKLAYLE